MSRECVICGRPLKTGRKYCYACKSVGNLPKQKHIKRLADVPNIFVIHTIMIIFGLIVLFSKANVLIKIILTTFITLYVITIMRSVLKGLSLKDINAPFVFFMTTIFLSILLILFIPNMPIKIKITIILIFIITAVVWINRWYRKKRIERFGKIAGLDYDL